MSDVPHGRMHWWLLRLSSLPLIPLFFYFLAQRQYLTTSDHPVFTGWLKQPVPALTLALFIFCAFFHACLGVEEIVEDYVSAQNIKKIVLGLNRFLFFTLGAACLYALTSLHYGS